MSLLKASKYRDPNYMKKYYQKNKDKMTQQSIESIAKRRQADKDFLKSISNLTCVSCGFKHDTSAPFDWHHIDPTEKEGGIGAMIGKVARKRLEKEVSKCVFLCKNCHAIEHERLLKEVTDESSQGE